MGKVMVQTRIEEEILAALAVYVCENYNIPRTKSELVSTCLHILVDELGLTELNTQTAKHVLEKTLNLNMNTRRPKKKEAYKELTSDGRVKSVLEKMKEGDTQ